MNYGRFLWLLVTLALLASLMLAIFYKISHPQPVYEEYQGHWIPPRAAERPA
jgi:hypothetical protein